VEYLGNDMTLSYSYYIMSIVSHMHSMEWWHFQCCWWTTNPVSRSRCFWSWLS